MTKAQSYEGTNAAPCLLGALFIGLALPGMSAAAPAAAEAGPQDEVTASSAPEAEGSVTPEPAAAEPARAEVTSDGDESTDQAEALLREFDDLFRGDSSEATMRMEIRTERWERTLRMQAWSRGTDRSLVRILSPPRERGTATLRVEGDLWNYLPNVDRTVRVPAGMMSASWMGSHFTNDDLVQETRYSEDYDSRVVSSPAEEPEGSWVIETAPKPRAPVVWGKVVIEMRGEDRLPTEARFYDERERLMRTMSFHDVGEMSGRRIPTRIRLTPADKPGEYTEMVYENISFDVNIPPETFTIQALRR